jgi:hypothetical protein
MGMLYTQASRDYSF